MKTVTEKGPGINWQAKYLEQVNFRLTNLEDGQHRIEDKMDTRFDKVDAKIEAGFREIRRMIWGTLGILGTAVVGVFVRSVI